MPQEPDVLVIGSGMGGGALAYALKDCGLRVHVIERGGYLPREPANASVEAVFHRKRYRSLDIWTDEKGKPFNPGIHYYVGGNTKVYGAAMMRLRERDFEDLDHEDGISPAWPISYAEIEPYYARAERMMGTRGGSGADPTEPQRSEPYPHAPIPHDPGIAALIGRLEGEGLHPFPLPVSIQQGDGGGCIRCMTCDGFPCPHDAKGDAENCCLRPALMTGNVTLETGAKALRLITSADGRTITGVEVETRDRIEIRRAPTVVLAAGAINSAALLLRSANARHPRGLANRSDQVGRNYMAHNPTAVMAVGFSATGVNYQKTFAINDYYFGMPDFDKPMGNLQMLGKLQAGMLTANVPFVPRAAMDALARRSIDWYVMSEDLPDPENRVVLDGDRIRLIYRQNNLGSHRRLVREIGRIMRRLGSPLILTRWLGLQTTSHQCGTVRFGRDPATSALDPFCKAWDLDNLYVVDGGFFPSSAAVNPALTIAAQALRVGDHLMDRLKVTRRERPGSEHDRQRVHLGSDSPRGVVRRESDAGRP
jgi:choline dehydrogenase-like flavoprotein